MWEKKLLAKNIQLQVAILTLKLRPNCQCSTVLKFMKYQSNKEEGAWEQVPWKYLKERFWWQTSTSSNTNCRTFCLCRSDVSKWYIAKLFLMLIVYNVRDITAFYKFCLYLLTKTYMFIFISSCCVIVWSLLFQLLDKNQIVLPSSMQMFKFLLLLRTFSI